MTFIPVQIPPGVVRQATPYDQPNTWWESSNVRWLSGAIMPIGGCSRITSSPLDAKVRQLFKWRDNSATEWMAIGTENSVSVLTGSVTDVTPTSFVSMNAIGGGGYGVMYYGTDTTPITDAAGTTLLSTATVTISVASPAVVTWNAHGLLNGSVVRFTVSGGSLPTGIVSGTSYYVINATANTFNVSTSLGGSAINTTGTSSGTITASWYVGQDTYGRQRSVNPPAFRKPEHWSFTNFGQDLLAVCSSDGRLLHLSTASGPINKMDVPSNAPVSNTAVAVTAERAVMLMGAGGYPRRVQWSNLEDYNSWTATATNQAGYIDIEASSPIITGVRVKEGILVLTQHEAFLVRYVGAPYYYGVEKLGATTFSAPNAIASGGSMTVWYGEEGFWRYDGGSVRLIPCPMFNDIKQNYNPLYGNYRAHMHENGQFPEFWFDYPDIHSTDGECNNYVIWNYAENIWMKGSRSRTASFGAVTASYPIAAGVDNNVYQHEDGWTDAGVSRVGTVWAETSVLNLGQNDSYLDINQALVSSDPDSDQTNYNISFYSRYAPTQTETVFGPYYPRTDGYTDTRVTGRDLRMRIEATNDDYWSLGQIRLDVASAGGRR